MTKTMTMPCSDDPIDRGPFRGTFRLRPTAAATAPDRTDPTSVLKAHVAKLAKDASDLAEQLKRAQRLAHEDFAVQLQKARRLATEADLLHERLDEVIVERDRAQAEQSGRSAG